MAVITVDSQDHNREFDLTYSSDEPSIIRNRTPFANGGVDIYYTDENETEPVTPTEPTVDPEEPVDDPTET